MVAAIENSMDTVYDVLIVGAGISGINAAYRVQTELPGSKYVVLEARGGMGGTWDFFKYPGIRSDSDLHTFGFPWRPWTEQKAIADGAEIKKYIVKSAESQGIDQHILYHHKLKNSSWSSETQTWTMTVDVDGQKKFFNAKFLIFGSGYYDYETPLEAEIPGLQNFKGTTVHPQFWPEDLDYTGKKMVIIGSGATAVTLLPSLAKKAAHVTMLQRSPGYIISLPAIDPFNNFQRNWLPRWIGQPLVRLKFLLLPWIFFNFCRTFPTVARFILRKRVERQLPKNVPFDPHFMPSYNPWEQRLCVVPDSDMFTALRAGNADIATGHIETMTDKEIILKSGQRLPCDILITATGLRIQMAGGSAVTVDGEPINFGQKFLWKGILMQDVPNMAVIIGYTNASWTLGADATARLITRLLKTMKARESSVVIPRLDDPSVQATPSLNLNSTYVQKAKDRMPKAGTSGPWQPKRNYFQDLWNAKWGNITQGLEFLRPVST